MTSIAGCFEPIQGGGVVIIGDPGERIAALCRFRHRTVDPLCAGGDAEGATQPESADTGAGAGSSTLDPAPDATLVAPPTDPAPMR